MIDYFGGITDLENKVLRHISKAFSEDPLRVFRLMRFWARFYYLGFVIAPETLDLCKEIVQSGEIENLSVERIWQESQKALSEKNPEKYFEGLFEIGALDLVLALKNNWTAKKLNSMNEGLIKVVPKTHNPKLRLALWANGDEEIIKALKKLKISRDFIRYLDLIKNTAQIFKNWDKESRENRYQALKSADKYLVELLEVLDLKNSSEIIAKNQQISEIRAKDLLKEGFLAGVELGEELKKRQLALL